MSAVRRPRARRLELATLFAALAGCVESVPPLCDVDGSPVDPAPSVAARATLWVFVSVDCPIANAMLPEVMKIASSLPPDVHSYLVYVDEDVSAERRRTHAREHSLRVRTVVDRGGALVARAGATITPEAVVFDADGNVAYRGRIDDRFPDLGARRPAPTRSDLRNALADLLAGRAIAVPRAAAVGCVIETGVVQDGE